MRKAKWIFIPVALTIVVSTVYFHAHASKPVAKQEVCSLTPRGVLDRVNAERTRLGVPSLTVDSRLVTTSGQKLQAMIDQQYFGHDSPDGKVTLFNLVGNQGIYNIKVAEDTSVNTVTNEQDWLDFKASDEHYASLIDPIYKQVGISTKCGLNYVIKHDTYTGDNKDISGLTATDLTVIHLAQ